MYSRSLSTSSRNHRPKGIIKAKHILQICLLVAIFFWLIYQVGPSHEKEKEFDAKDTKLASETQSTSEILRLGRKDISRATETNMDTKLHEGDDQENEADEEETRDAEEEKESLESRIDDREEGEDVDKPEEDKFDDEVQDDLLLDEDNDDSEKKDNEESETVLEDHDQDNLIVPGFISSENSTVLRELNDQSQRSKNLTESESKQSNDMIQTQNATYGDSHIEDSNTPVSLLNENHLDVKAHSNFTQNVHITSEESLGSSAEVKLPLAGVLETKADDFASNDLDDPLDYSGFSFT